MILYANLADTTAERKYEAGWNHYDVSRSYNDFIEKKHGYDSAPEHTIRTCRFTIHRTPVSLAVETYENSLSAYQQSKSQ